MLCCKASYSTLCTFTFYTEHAYRLCRIHVCLRIFICLQLGLQDVPEITDVQWNYWAGWCSSWDCMWTYCWFLQSNTSWKQLPDATLPLLKWALGSTEGCNFKSYVLAITSTNRPTAFPIKRYPSLKFFSWQLLWPWFPCCSRLYLGQRTLYLGLRRTCATQPIKSHSSKVWVASWLSGGLVLV